MLNHFMCKLYGRHVKLNIGIFSGNIRNPGHFYARVRDWIDSLALSESKLVPRWIFLVHYLVNLTIETN